MIHKDFDIFMHLSDVYCYFMMCNVHWIFNIF